MLGNHNDSLENHFTGKERDAESGNDYFGARYYNSATGRWISPDWSLNQQPVPYAKFDNPQSLNLYSYVYDDPVSGVDLDGHTEGETDVQKAFDGRAAMDAEDATASLRKAQQQSLPDKLEGVDNSISGANGLYGTIKKWFGRAKTGQEIARDGSEYKSWIKIQGLADAAYQRDPTSSYGILQLTVSQLAQANEKYLLIEAGVKTNGLFDGAPFVGGLTPGLLPVARKSILGPAEENYRYALHAWQADVASQR